MVRHYIATRPKCRLPRSDKKCSPIALELGTTAPDIILFPYINEPETGSRMPSMSTGGAAMKASIKQVVAVNKQGIISTPNQPTYSLLSVLVTH